MTPAEAIATLDDQITRHGQPVALRRGSSGPQHDALAFVRGYRPEELVGLIQQADRGVTLSPTSLEGFGLPRSGDAFSAAGRPGVVQDDVEPIHIGGVLVRVNLRVRFA